MNSGKVKEMIAPREAGIALKAAARAVTALAIITLSAACASVHEPWTHLNPPRKNDYFAQIDKFIWCKTKDSAQAMAITGFFATGCEYTRLKPNTYKVVEISRGSFGTTDVVFVRCLGPDGVIWIPLPSHGWA